MRTTKNKRFNCSNLECLQMEKQHLRAEIDRQQIRVEQHFVSVMGAVEQLSVMGKLVKQAVGVVSAFKSVQTGYALFSTLLQWLLPATVAQTPPKQHEAVDPE